jgi:hypothetical protein
VENTAEGGVQFSLTLPVFHGEKQS